MLELSQFEASRTCCTITELTVEGIANLEESNSVLMAERDRLMQENAILKESNASLCEEIAILRKAVITPESLMDDDTKGTIQAYHHIKF